MGGVCFALFSFITDLILTWIASFSSFLYFGFCYVRLKGYVMFDHSLRFMFQLSGR